MPSLAGQSVSCAQELIDEVVNEVDNNEECKGVYNLIELFLEQECGEFIAETGDVAGDCGFPRFVGLRLEMQFVVQFFTLPPRYSVPQKMKSRQPMASIEIEPGVLVQPWLTREEYLGVH